MSALRAVVAEDEALLRQSLLTLLAEVCPQLQIVGDCEDGASALEVIATQQPDVAFLDSRMPGLTGIEVARAMRQVGPRSQVVFVTAYDQYAIDAFEHGAVDYLLKPISHERLQAAWQRVQHAPLLASRMARCWRPCCSVCRHARRRPVLRRRWPGSPPAAAARRA
ncbi:hypothetical protein ATY48_03030 [Xanthomonas oryzae pv. oryzae]|nr:hypothetical protein APZ20_20190 [Xanthomonas oryzae pv. oryzae]BAE67351.1 conserved hypothetical protein [Xanthomonas oryzae pv. oryzae MAFF 311018]AOS01190.1 hypothetical protein ATY42_03040 [Xanthomonas oryzae pv. oryzae]AOS08077.1 hypothetical protein ATY43_21080 [Xanthomonas oryzae pv. oryzae]AOS12260.1 hypothetical protein ATY44_20355 [Xanthomonas oryzae pv. oryzae]